jgi:hypothetical protein
MYVVQGAMTFVAAAYVVYAHRQGFTMSRLARDSTNTLAGLVFNYAHIDGQSPTHVMAKVYAAAPGVDPIVVAHHPCE